MKARCEASLLEFVREGWHVLEPGRPFIYGWHIKAICDHLEAISRGTFLEMGYENRLQINVPPGMMKSLLTSVFWPAWEWGPFNMPALRYLTTSYSEPFALRDARKMRDLVVSPWYQELWGDRVRLVRDGERSFSNSASGSRDARPFTSLTAGRGDRVIADDPHSTETAESDAERARTSRVFRESMSLRLNDPVTSAIIVIMQRLHQEDVCGVIEDLGLPYIKLVLPMEFEPERACRTPIFTDPRTQEGELLFPERFPRTAVERDSVPLGSYGTAGQFQQRPAPRSGGLFGRGWWKVVDALPAQRIRVARGWDLAATESLQAARTAGVKMSLTTDGTICIEDVRADQVSPSGAEAMVYNTATQDGPQVGIDIPQDPGQAGKAQVAAYVKKLHGFDVRFSPETGSKVDRARPLSAQAEAGNVVLLRAPWNTAFIDEAALFPNGKYKDMVDAASRAYARLLQAPPQRPRVAKPEVIR